MRTYTTPLTLTLTLCSACADDLALEDDFVGNDPITTREVYPCNEYAAKIPADQTARLNLFKKVGVITNLSVVNDPCRTTWDLVKWTDLKCVETTKGVWTFWYLMSQMAGDGDPSEFIFTMLESFETATPVNDVPLTLRTGVRSKVIDPWRVASGCAPGKKWADDKCAIKPDKIKAPILLAIVNRQDLRPSMDGQVNCGYYQCQDQDSQAGEGRFVFGFLDGAGKSIEATVILEYALPTKIGWSRVNWANEWLSLANYPNYDATYLAKLQSITDRFTKKNSFPGKPNQGSAIKAVRTNDRAFDTNANKVWSLRAFKLSCAACTNGKLVPRTVEQTPRNIYQDSKLLLEFLNTNGVAIRQGTHKVPEDFGNPVENFIGGESASNPIFEMNPFIWAGNLQVQLNDLLNAPDTRRLFGIGTCNGCHYKETENLNNMHIKHPAAPGQEAKLSAFLIDSPHILTTIFDKDGVEVVFDEQRRRLCEFYQTQSGKGKVLTTHFGSPH